ncbi:MAG: hypothetical protein ACYSUT_05900 [Planctomycetota bacterium]|jgi:hypothetical protein
MKHILFIAACCISLVIFSGCAQYWYQEDTTFNQCQQAQKECLDALLQRSDMSYVSDYEIEFMKTCMYEKGYRLVTEDELPMDVKRKKPETSLHWRMKGIAGTID